MKATRSVEKFGNFDDDDDDYKRDHACKMTFVTFFFS